MPHTRVPLALNKTLSLPLHHRLSSYPRSLFRTRKLKPAVAARSGNSYGKTLVEVKRLEKEKEHQERSVSFPLNDLLRVHSRAASNPHLHHRPSSYARSLVRMWNLCRTSLSSSLLPLQRADSRMEKPWPSEAAREGASGKIGTVHFIK